MISLLVVLLFSNVLRADNLDNLISQDSAFKVNEAFRQPSKRTCGSAKFVLQPERVIQPGESLYFAVPSDLTDRPVSWVIIGHRQDPRTQRGRSDNDDFPGYTTTQVHSVVASEGWRYWGGMSSAPFGGKFAEIKYDAELDGLYQWTYEGHGNADQATPGPLVHTPLIGDAMRIRSFGKDNVYVSELTIKAVPLPADNYIEESFSGGKAGDPVTSQGFSYGSDSGALNLGGYSNIYPILPKGWSVSGNQLIIPIPAGATVTGVDAIVGDGQNGYPGGAKLSMALRKANGTTDWFMERENVPPQGILTASPTDCKNVSGRGDVVIIQSDWDTTHVRGVRVGLKVPLNLPH